ncbi:hypothetical protein PILCRDRAFT_828142 [Piloderma croceum F 1598]|uniref:Uncharacterized protein n=1 Tax=Piloderma croceum (strain F 1598) TaxID=765440 RepID=A0A0C3EPF4_PILCF|nr:hypothetical protein PILCRDRAFT_828142 [Piloderma croceum F 1598]
MQRYPNESKKLSTQCVQGQPVTIHTWHLQNISCGDRSLVGSAIATMQSDREYVVPLAGVVIKEKTRATAESEACITSDGRPDMTL